MSRTMLMTGLAVVRSLLPGLVAMLLYAAVRVLPPAFTTDLTFSTYEPAHRGIGRCRKSVGSLGGHGGYNMHRLIGQRGNRGPD